MLLKLSIYGKQNLSAAKEAKKDEFYTQLEDINKEPKYYREHFRGKTVLCNCDDPRISNFFTYFAYNFEFLGLSYFLILYFLFLYSPSISRMPSPTSCFR